MARTTSQQLAALFLCRGRLGSAPDSRAMRLKVVRCNAPPLCRRHAPVRKKTSRNADIPSYLATWVRTFQRRPLCRRISMQPIPWSTLHGWSRLNNKRLLNKTVLRTETHSQVESKPHADLYRACTKRRLVLQSRFRIDTPALRKTSAAEQTRRIQPHDRRCCFRRCPAQLRVLRTTLTAGLLTLSLSSFLVLILHNSRDANPAASFGKGRTNTHNLS